MFSLVLTLIAGLQAPALRYESCGESVQLMKMPERAISMDINTSEIMLSLGLASRMVAIAGVNDRKEVLPALRADFDKIPRVDASYPGLDALVGRKPDFVFGGWQYGFSESSGLTPQRLKKFGINSYALAESCIRIQSRAQVSLDDVFVDINSIGRIFGRQAEAESLVNSYRQKLAALRKNRTVNPGIRVFLYDGGESSPYTAGRFAIPQAMIEEAGASNIFADIKSSWTTVSWESVVARKPNFIIIVDYGDRSAEQKIRFLENKFRQTSLDALAKQRYLILPYAAVTPGVRTVAATEELAEALRRHFPKAGT